jgi:SAM-dependent methyltransferase
MTQDWGDGYVTDLTYTHHFFPELAPLHLSFAAFSNGRAAPDASRPFNWLELGCGSGLTATVFAATYPHGEFHAVDFNPEHIASGTQLASEAKLTNLHFYETSFQEALDQSWPAMDYIVLHGVWSWINDANRAYVVALLKKLLKPGGLVYISYNCLPGRTSQGPIQHLMRAYAQTFHGDSGSKAREALQAVQALMKTEAAYFRASTQAETVIGRMSAQTSSYLAHEYLNQNWYLCYSDELAEVLGAAKLTRVASATLIDNVDELAVPPSCREQLQSLPKGPHRELIRDYMVNSGFRRDVYGRGAPVLTSVQQAMVMAEQLYISANLESPDSVKIKTGWGEVEAKQENYAPLLQALMEKPLNAREVAERLRRPLGQILADLKLLVGSGHVRLAAAWAESANESVARLNKALLNHFVVGDGRTVLASARFAGGVSIPPIDQLFLQCVLLCPDNEVEWLQNHLQLLNITPKIGGELVRDAAQIQAILPTMLERFREMVMPSFVRLRVGIV